MIIRFKLNGQDVVQVVKPNETLLDALRDRMKITSVKKGCDEGSCGSCTVLMDGVPVRSCLLLAVQASDTSITTVEGLAPTGKLSEIQQAFLEKNGFQCGFCTSGMMLTAKGLLDTNSKPTLDDIKDAFDGSLCRCTGYQQIIESVQRAAELRAKK